MQLKYVSGSVLAADDTLGERQIRVIASDPTIDRVKDVMVPEGCVLDSYKNNPIFLFNHDPAMPIGNATVAIKNGRVEALVDFAPKGISAKADECCALYKAGVLRAVSVGFQPIEAEPIKDGGMRYNKWALMELSGVAVPANPNAITVERSLETATMTTKASSWKCGASRNLPVDEESAWDGAAAEKSIFDHCGFDGDSPNTALARKGFLLYDAANPKLKGSYKEPFAKMTGGRMTAVAAGIRNAASRLPQVDGASDEAKNAARAVIDHYESKFGKGISSEDDLVRALAALPPEKLKSLLSKAGRVLSQENMDHLNEIGKCLKGMAECGEKGAKLHDDLHDLMVEWMDHGTSAGDHLKAMVKSASRHDNDDDDSSDDDDGSDVSDPDNSDRELAADVEARKRLVEVLDRAG
jgi:HK97 family phage prohead protease